MNHFQLAKGYKKTEVGLIPEDWTLSKLGKYANFKTGPFGSALHKSDYVYGGIPVINPMQIVAGNIEPTQSMAITEQAAKKLSYFRLCAGEIIIGRRGEMGRCAFIRIEQQGWICGTGSMVIQPANAIDGSFLQRVLTSPPIIAAIENASVGSTMINLNQGTLGNLVIALPPTKAEQCAIAEALSDADALIESLEQLIAKKRQIKQGAMQELLTGKRRLPGFSGEWEVKRLDAVAEIDLDNLASTTPSEYAFNYISLEDVNIGSLISYSEVIFSSAPSRARRRLRRGDILVSTVRPSLKSHLLFTNALPNWVCSTGFSVMRCKNQEVSPGYIFFHLFGHYVNQQIQALLIGSNYPAINGKDMKALEIPIPKLPEQEAIATILSDMDTEIAALEAKLTKARQIKQGMMHELLTGKVRLI